ncbi:hypothetical protein Herbaro_04195 [Herbaspirillum sp. WKF16]|jgi:hypothetical protein|nr:hypothetical protein [Herbaspirillum sp. WKF16]WDZ96998.1 hypothetical protein Herbaro_04195 [Herbaspirillum sp. WKF16]
MRISAIVLGTVFMLHSQVASAKGVMSHLVDGFVFFMNNWY